MMKKAIRIVILVLALLALTQMASAGSANAPLYVSATVLPKGRFSTTGQVPAMGLRAGQDSISEATRGYVTVSATRGLQYRVVVDGPSHPEAERQAGGVDASRITIEW